MTVRKENLYPFGERAEPEITSEVATGSAQKLAIVSFGHIRARGERCPSVFSEPAIRSITASHEGNKMALYT